MTDDNAEGKASGPQLTDREKTVILAAFRCLKSGPPEIDYNKLAQELGLKDSKSACAAWSKVKAKVITASPPDEAGEGQKPVKPKTPRKPKDTTAVKTVKATPKAGKKSESKLKAEADADADIGPETDAPDSEVTDLKTEVEETNGDTKMEDTDAPEITNDKGEDDGESDAGGPENGGGVVSPPATPAAVEHLNVTKKIDTILATPALPSKIEEAAAETPTTGTHPAAPAPKKRGRKSKAQKEAEAAENGEAVEDDEKPAKKPRKTPVKKAKKESDGTLQIIDDTPQTPKPRAPRKPGTAAKAKVDSTAEAAIVEGDEDSATKIARLRKEGEEAKMKAQLAQDALDAAEANAILMGKKAEQDVEGTGNAKQISIESPRQAGVEEEDEDAVKDSKMTDDDGTNGVAYPTEPKKNSTAPPAVPDKGLNNDTVIVAPADDVDTVVVVTD